VIVVIDAGIVSEDDLQWLKKPDHDWVVVDRMRPCIPQGEPDAENVSAGKYEVCISRMPGASDDGCVFVYTMPHANGQNPACSKAPVCHWMRF